jgi:hypothetical protein
MTAQPLPQGSVPPPQAAPPSATHRITGALAWVVAVLIVAVAGAGLILTLDHPPTDERRPELTARGHALVAPRLAAMDPELEGLATSGDAIAAAGRQTLTRLRALDASGTNDALIAGDSALTSLTEVRGRSLAARATLLQGTSLDRASIGLASRPSMPRSPPRASSARSGRRS